VLYYHRPLFEDGTGAYRFWHDAGPAAVHPAVGGLAFLLEPGGVAEYHFAAARLEDPKPARREVPASRRGPTPLPLRSGDWNHVEVTLAGNMLSLKLNGELIYERDAPAAAGRHFGFCGDVSETPVRVRDVVWRGGWPRRPAAEKP
jgi:hypothetical protein